MKITAFTFYPDPDGYFYNPWHTDSPSNYTYSNPAYDAIVEEARATLDPAARHELYDQAAQILLRMTAAVVFGFFVGMQREKAGKPAGVRTHMLVSLGTAIVVLACAGMGMQYDAQSRVIQGIVTGIGVVDCVQPAAAYIDKLAAQYDAAKSRICG